MSKCASRRSREPDVSDRQDLLLVVFFWGGGGTPPPEVCYRQVLRRMLSPEDACGIIWSIGHIQDFPLLDCEVSLGEI